MRRLLLIILLCILPLILIANLVQNKPTEYTQPDGTKLSLFVSGDEYYHRVHDAEGFTILRHPETGYAVYAVPDGNTIKASNYRVGQINPASLGISANLFANTDEAQTTAREQQRLRNEGNRAASIGTIQNIIAFVRFHEQTEFPTTPSYASFDNIFNSTTTASLWGLYNEMSSGQLDIESHLYPGPGSFGYIFSIRVSHDRGYYSPYHATDNPIGYTSDAMRWTRHTGLVTEICGMLDPYVPPEMVLDNNSDGIVDALTFIYRGGVDDWGDILWPTHWSASGTVTTLNGFNVTHWVGDFEGGIGTSVVSHEMGHMIGAPDLYHYYDAPMGNHYPWKGISPASSWDLMNSDNTQHWLTFMKYKYGQWFPSIPTITPTTTPTTYSLTAIDQSPYSCYSIASSTPGQFYMLEYRRQAGLYEVGIPGSGLIVSRILTSFGGSGLNGNSQGPPDEVYVYRPGGVVNTNGEPWNAYFSSQSGRTGFYNSTNPKPWLYADTLSTPNGNLVITDIGASGGSTITFSIRSVAPNIWTGASSTNWGTPGNWSLGVPISTQYVEIPGGLSNYPHVSSGSNCGNLKIYAGASLTVDSSYLGIWGNLTNYGTVNLSAATSDLIVDGSVYWESGSSLSVTNANAEFFCKGDMEFKAGSAVNMTNGYMEFNGAVNSNIRVYTATVLNHLRINKPSSYYANYSVLSTSNLQINGNFINLAGSAYYHSSDYTIVINGSFTNVSGGNFYMSSGTVEFNSTSTAYISDSSTTSYFHDLKINKGAFAYVNLNTAIQVKGQFYLYLGSFDTYGYNMTVGGNWLNNAGTGAFYERTGRVIFNGTSDQTCSTETFYAMELNKTSGTMIIPSGKTVTCTVYDWTAGGYTVNGGIFTVGDLDDAGIFGTITLNSGAITYTQDVPSYIDLRGNLTIHAGTFNIYGGSGPCYFSYIDTATLTMDGGILDFKNVGIYISSSYAFNDNISGGTIRTYLGVSVQRTDFNPTGGTIELYGTSDCTLNLTAGSNFFNILINKGAREESSPKTGIDIAVTKEEDFYVNRNGTKEPVTRSNIVTGMGPLDLNGSFTLSSGTFIAPATMQIAGNWSNTVGPSAFNEGTGSVEFNGSGHQYCNYNENFYTLLINKSGGALRLNNASEVVTCTYYTWTAGAVDVLTGTFTANDLTQNGIYGNFYVNPNGTINLYQDAGQWIDLDGYFYNYGGNINVYGGSLSTYWAYSANAGITMSSGTIDFKNRGIAITASAFTLTMNVTGGTIRANGGYACSRTNVNFSGGIVELYGSGYPAVTTTTGCYFYDLKINKTASRGEEPILHKSGVERYNSHGRTEEIDYRLDGVSLGSDIVMYGSLTVQAGLLDLNSFHLTAYNDVNIYGTVKMATTSCNLYSGDDMVWYSGSSSQISSGYLYCLGNWYFNPGSAAQLTGSITFLGADYGADITTSSPNSWFGNLYIAGGGGGEGAFYEISDTSTDSLLVKGILTINSENYLNLTGHDAHIDNSVTISPSASLFIGTGGYCLMKSSLDQQGTLSIGSGIVIVQGTYTSYTTSVFSLAGGQFINNVAWAKSNSPVREDISPDSDRSIVEFKGAMTVNGGLIEVTNNTVIFRGHATRTFNPAIVKVGAGFTANEVNAFHLDSGELQLIGNNNPTVDISNGNYVYGLRINKSLNSNYAYLQTDILIKGSLVIQVGGIVTNNHNITINGYWTNSVGSSAFSEGTGTVTFAGNSDATGVSTSETFYNLTLNNSSVNYTNFEQATGTTATVTNNLQITDGTYNMLGTANLVIGNDLLISSGAGLNSAAATAPTISLGRHLTDSNTSWSSTTGFYTMNSTLTFTGGLVQTMTVSEPTFDVGSLVFNKTSSTNEVHFTKNTRVFGNCTITTGMWVDNSTSLTHEFYGNLTFGASGIWWVNNNNTIAFKGSQAQVFNHGGTGSIRHLTVDKTAGATVTFGHYVLGLNGGNVLVNSGILNIGSYYYRTTGNVTINNHGKISIGSDGWLEIATALALTVNNGGILEVIGTSGHLAKVTRQSGNYAFNVESGGTLSAEYATFEYMNTNGVYLKAGSIVDATHALHNCTFQLGASGGTLLTIDNNSTINITNASFPTNTWSGTNNVKKTVNNGTVNFINATGAFSGAAYESDAYGRINWQTATADLRVTVFTYSNNSPYVCDPLTINVTVSNIGAGNVTSSFRVDVYYNRTTPPPTGLLGDLTHTFTSLAAGASASWAFTNVSTATAGTWVSYAQVDPNALITEANESNNVATPVTVTWNAIPTVTGLTTTYMPERNQINLQWTACPIPVGRYNIYYDADPYGSFSTFLTTTTNTSYMETASQMKRFYRIKAERDLP